MLESLNLPSFSSLAPKYSRTRPRRESAPPVRYSSRAKPPMTRSRLTSSGSSPHNSDHDYTPRKRPLDDDSDSDDESEIVSVKRRRVTMHSHPGRWIKNPNASFLAPEAVTKSELNKVSTNYGSKVYNQVR